MEYKFLANINYKGERFKILSNKNHMKYFLRILDDGTLLYPTLEEFSELDKIFNSKSKSMYFINKKDSISKASTKDYYGKIYKLIPKIIHNGTLISLASAMLLVGCAQDITIDDFIIQNDATYEEDESRTTETDQNCIVTTEISEKYILDNSNVETDILPGEIYVVRSRNDGRQIFCKDMDEFRKHVDVKNPTFDDVRAAIKNNENIPDNYKEWLNEGIDNLEVNLSDMDLVVLYYNISRMNCISKTSEEIKADTGVAMAGAYFDYRDASVVINDDTVNKWTFLHEALGHASTEVNIDDKIIKSTRIYCISLTKDGDGNLAKDDEGKYIAEEFFWGNGIEEGKADLLTQIATGEPVESAAYEVELEELRIFMETTGLTLEELINGGTEVLINAMHDNDIGNPGDYIDSLEIVCKVEQNCDLSMIDSINISDDITRYILDFCDDKIERGESKKDVIKKVTDIINNSDFEYFTSQSGALMIDMIKPSELAKEIVDEINNNFGKPKIEVEESTTHKKSNEEEPEL